MENNNNNTNNNDNNSSNNSINNDNNNDFDFTDDLALLSHTHETIQMKTTSVAAASASVDLNTHKGRCKILKYNTGKTNPITLDGEDLEDVQPFA
ncbi:unnamed protein product [Schistosoma curassoni]|uniref:SEP domain-containing protein n=1 Tax=Schistosoma curassoni TaxID=6186 RepID=A0A183L4E6_9TREM|nr:unnamed protein product [Schistosoma curassoni]